MCRADIYPRNCSQPTPSFHCHSSEEQVCSFSWGSGLRLPEPQSNPDSSDFPHLQHGFPISPGNSFLTWTDQALFSGWYVLLESCYLSRFPSVMGLVYSQHYFSQMGTKKSGVDNKLGRCKTPSYTKGPVVVLLYTTNWEGVVASELGTLHCIRHCWVLEGNAKWQYSATEGQVCSFCWWRNRGKWELGDSVSQRSTISTGYGGFL